MNHLIVPTDFSENAKNALIFAINIANHYDDCTIHLIHVYETRAETGIMAPVKDFMTNQANRSLQELVSEVKPNLLHGTDLVAKAIEGFATDIIIQYAKIVEADFIIMGTQGASGLKEIFMGSNTAGVIKESQTPVLAIPAECKYRSFRDIVLAIDSNIVSTDEVLQPMTQLAKKYNSKIKIVHVGKEKEAAAVDAGVDIYLSDFKHSFHFVEDKNINHGINQFVEEHDESDLLCMIRRDRSFFSELFHRSATTKEVFDSPLPLLIMYDKA